MVLIKLLWVWRKLASLAIHFDDLFKSICEDVLLHKNVFFCEALRERFLRGVSV